MVGQKDDDVGQGFRYGLARLGLSPHTNSGQWEAVAPTARAPVSLSHKLGKHIKTFCEHTSAHGLGHVVRTERIGVKAVWLCLFLGALTTISVQIYTVLAIFYSYPVQEVNQISQEPMPFPDVTICNIEPIVSSQALTISRDPTTRTYEHLERKVPELQELLSQYPNLSYFSDSNIISVGAFYENQRPEESRAVSHSLQDLVVRCRYAGQDCLSQPQHYFSFLPDGTYYNCYTFSTSRVSSMAEGLGPDRGLSLMLYLDATTEEPFLQGNFGDESNVKYSAGVRVTVHGQSTLPFPALQGFDIMPGHSTSVGVSMTRTERLTSPHGNCTQATYSDEAQTVLYSAIACNQFALQAFVYKKCGCLRADLPVLARVQDLPYCGFYDYDPAPYLERLRCSREAMQVYAQDAKYCPAACSEYTYDLIISEAAWPHRRYQDSFFQEVVASHPQRDTLRAYTNVAGLKSGGTFRNTTAITDNFARLNVFLRSTEVLVRSQVPSYGYSSLLSDLGGTLGLWAGLSILTICEVLFLLASLMATLLKGARAQKPQ